MKTTGVIRQLDSLGRIVLPIELRRTLDIGPKDMLEIFLTRTAAPISALEPDCLFCGSGHALFSYREKMICSRCLKEMKQL